MHHFAIDRLSIDGNLLLSKHRAKCDSFDGKKLFQIIFYEQPTLSELNEQHMTNSINTIPLIGIKIPLPII
jgi:hypothetical protein